MQKNQSPKNDVSANSDKNRDGKTNNLIYIGIIIVVVIIAYFGLSAINNGKASIAVSLNATNSTNLYPLNTTKFSISINNTGSTYLKGLDVGFYLGNGTLNVYNISLPPNKNVLIPINYTYSVSGIYKFKVVADPSNIFNFSNKSVKTANVTIIVKQPVSPSKLLIFPKGNVTSIYNFSFMGSTLPLIAAQTNYYNITKLNTIFSVDPEIQHVIIGDFYGSIYSSAGTYVKYSNNSSAESILFSGIGPSPLYKVLSSFGFNSVKVNNTDEFKVSNNIISCLSYNNGWTELSMYNGINSCSIQTPLNISGITNKTLFNSYNITHYAQGFRYKNSTYLGALYGFDKNGSYWYNIFNISYGLFISGISTHGNITQYDNKCYGIISNTSNVCSIYINPSKSLTSQFGVIRSSEITQNYNFSIYSIVNNTQLVDASYNAEHLISALNSTQKAILWKSAINDTCGFSNTNAISCSVANFSYSNNLGTLSIKNNLNKNITLIQGSCFVGGLAYNNTLNVTIAPAASNSITLSCKNILVPIISAQTSYTLSFVYKNNSGIYNVTGILNVSNII